nr:MAG: ABC transporter permease [Caldicoprobacter oshimai]
MMRKSAWYKNNFREIKHSLERYLAIVAIIALGVGFFSGLKITRSAMVKSLDTYAYSQKMYDFRLISTLGFTEEDVQYFAQLEGMTAEGAISMDFIADIGTENEVVLRAHSITEKVNRLNILYGRMAETGSECVVDSRFFSPDMLGSKIRVSSTNDDDTLDAFTYDEYTIVGIANSPNYLNYDRGTTSLAGGSVYAFIYIPEDGFSVDYYTEILVRLDGYREVYSDEYEDAISEKEMVLKEQLEERGKKRYQDIVDEARQKVYDAQKEYDEAYEKYLAEKADTEEKLNQAWEELEQARQEIEKQEKRLKDAQQKIAAGERDYQKSVQDYEKAIEEYEQEKAKILAELKSRQEELDKNRTSVVSAMKQIENSGVLNQYHQLSETIRSLEEMLSRIGNSESQEYAAIEAQLNQARMALVQIEETGIIDQYAELQEALAQIDAGQKELDQAKEEANRKLSAAEAQLAELKSKLDFARNEIDKNKREAQKGWKALEKGKAEYEKGLADYEVAKKEAEEAFAKAEEELREAKKEIDDAWKKVDDIPKPKVYVLTRKQNIGYISFENDSAIVEGIAKVLPIFFFLVAALVCSTTMTRMVDEQRTQIGTLKALGYSDGAIIRKYTFYSGSAAILGCTIGYILGTKYFPLAIWEAYSVLYGFSSIEYVFDASLAAISLGASLLCSVGVTYISCKAELMEVPAQLLRPKAPQPGKRVLLEYIPALWNRISFLHKVSIRNILRYKRRFFMTVLGIAGCTALVVAAMGVRDSIRNIVNDQFDTITIYDYTISFTEAQSEQEREKFVQEFSNVLSQCVFVCTDEMEVVQGDRVKKVSVVATDDPDITKVIALYLNGEPVPYPDFGQVVINDKLAEEFGLTQGDTITIRYNGVDMVEAKISGIFENYVGNYLFMTAETYEALFGKEALYKNAYAKTDQKDLYLVSAQLSKGKGVASVSVLNDLRIMVNNMMQSLDYIIWLVIACAGTLGFVVIYNLNNINIMERNREIATLKVLGFYPWETRSYVFRETIILTVIGCIFGLGFGKLLHEFVMDQINIEMVSFKKQIFGLSYLIAVIVTFMITFLVNLMLQKKIEKINMAESLKSIE